MTSSTGSQSAASPARVSGWASTPITTPMTACAAAVAVRGIWAGANPVSASAVATSRPANSAGEGTPSAAIAAVPAAVSPASSPQRTHGCDLIAPILEHSGRWGAGNERWGCSPVQQRDPYSTGSDPALPPAIQTVFALQNDDPCRSRSEVLPPGRPATPAHDHGRAR